MTPSFIHRAVLFLIIFAVAPVSISATPSRAFINDTEVLVREEPTTASRAIDALDKNTVVDVIQTSDKKQKIGNESYHWYRIRTSDLTGWVYGKYVSMDLSKISNPYRDTDDMKWYFSRFGNSTQFLETATLDTFTKEQYRSLIANLMDESRSTRRNQQFALLSLGATLLKHLKENPEDKKYSELKSAVYNDAFIEKAFSRRRTTRFLYKYAPETDNRKLIRKLIENNYHAFSAAAPTLENDKDLAMAAIRKNGRALQYASKQLQNDRDLVMAAVRRNSSALKFASPALKSDREIVKTAVSESARALNYADPKFRADREIMLSAVQQDGELLRYAIDPDREVVLAAVTELGRALRYVPYEFTDDEEIKETAFYQKGRNDWDNADREDYKKFGEVARITEDEVSILEKPDDKGKQLGLLYKNMVVDVVDQSKNVTVVEDTPYHWYHVRYDNLDGWINGKYMTFYVPDKNPDPYLSRGIPYTDELYGGSHWFYERFGYSTSFSTTDITVDSFTLDQYRDLITSAMQGDNRMAAMRALKASIYAYLKEHPDDPEYAFLKKKVYSPEFIGKTAQGDDLSYLPDSFLNDADIVFELVRNNGMYLAQASPALRDNKAVVTEAVKENPRSFQYASERLRSDLELVKQFVAIDSRVYEYATRSVREDRGLTLAAVRAHGDLLEFAPKKLKGDRRIVEAAVRSRGYALSDAAEQYKNDREIVLLAVKQSGMALRYAAPQFQADRSVVLAAVGEDEHALQYASEPLRSDRAIVSAAIETSATGLLHASDELQSDKQLIHKALKTADAYYRAKRIFELVGNRHADVIDALKVYRRNPNKRSRSHGFKFVDDQLWSDPEFIFRLAREWNAFGSCNFFWHVDDDLMENPEFVEKLENLNTNCPP